MSEAGAQIVISVVSSIWFCANFACRRMGVIPPPLPFPTNDRQVPVTIEQQITAIIDEHVRPYIEMDGGSIEFTRFEDSVVYVRLSGACNTCPSSSVTLKGGVERQLCERLPQVRSVELDSAGADSVDAFEMTVIRF